MPLSSSTSSLAKNKSETLTLLYRRLNETVLVSPNEKATFTTHLDGVRQALPQGREEEVAFQPASLPSIQVIAAGLEVEESSLLTANLLTIPETTLTTGTRSKTH